MSADTADEVRKEFGDRVNMTPKELESWLETDESKAVGQKDGDEESVGHASGRRIVELLRTKKTISPTTTSATCARSTATSPAISSSVLTIPTRSSPA